MRVQPIEQLSGFFHERLRAAIERRRLQIGGTLQIYVVDLLERYAATEPDRAMRPLVEHLSEALEAPTALDRLRRYREMGDSALCVCGLFHEHLTARGISRRYVVTMGGHAYHHAGRLAGGPGAGTRGTAGVFDELAQRFDEIARVLDDVREETALRTPQDVVRLYERWRRTHSPVLAERLRRAGVYPQARRRGLLH
ncbi:MAG: hypothetical protein ACOC97_04815 [Myxococcota bacterium]